MRKIEIVIKVANLSLFHRINFFLEKSQLFKGVAVYGASNLLSALSPFILLPLLTYHLTPSEFGVFSIFLLFFNVFTILSGVNVNGCISVNYFKLKPKEFSLFVFNCLFLSFLVFLFFLSFFPFFSPYLEKFAKIDKEIIFLSIVVGFLNVCFLSALAIMQSSNNPFLFFKLKLVQSLGDVLLSIFLVAFLVHGLSGRIISFSLAIACCSFFSIVFLLKKKYISFCFDGNSIKKALRFGVPLLPHALSGSFIMFADRLVITRLIDTDATGIYMAGLQVGMIMLLIVEPINKAYAPWLFKKISGDNFLSEKSKIVKGSYLYFSFLLFFAAVMYFFTDLFFYFLIDEKYYEAKKCMMYFYFGFAFQGMYYTVTNYIFYAEKTARLSFVTMVTAVFGVFLSFMLVVRFGIVGASVAFMFTNFLLFLLTWYVSRRCVDMPWFNFIKGC